MGADCRDRALGEGRDLGLDGPEAHAAVHQQVAVATVNEPHVTSHPGRHVALEDAAQAIIDERRRIDAVELIGEQIELDLGIQFNDDRII